MPETAQVSCTLPEKLPCAAIIIVSFTLPPRRSERLVDVTVNVKSGPTPTGGVMVTEAVADLVVSATLVALTVPMVFAVTVGAVNKPVLETVPIVADQVTDVFVAFETVAVNCWAPPDVTVADVGEIVTAPVARAVIVTVALADLVVSATLVAVTVAVVFDVTVGAL